MAKKSKYPAEHKELQPAEPQSGWLTGYLRQSIEESGLSQFEIARRAGIAPQQLYRFMKENKTLTLDTVDKIIPVLNKNFGLKLMSLELAQLQLGQSQQKLLGHIEQLQDALADLKTIVVNGLNSDED